MRQRPHVIALAGPNGVGKSTVAAAIAGMRADFTIVESFAYPIHETLARMGVGLFARPKDAIIEGCGKTYRELCIALGQTTREMLGQGVYADRVERRILEASRCGGDWLVVIDDLRQPSEAQMVHAMGGVVIELQRDTIQYSGGTLDRRLPPTLIDATVPAMPGDAAEAARHILRLTGWT